MFIPMAEMARRLETSPKTLKNRSFPDNIVGRRVFYEDDREDEIAADLGRFKCFVCDRYMGRLSDPEQYYTYMFRPVHKNCYTEKKREEYDAHTSRPVDETHDRDKPAPG